MASVSTSDFWTDLYARGADGWDIRQPTPPLVEFIDHTPPAPGRVAVPGCGRGHDVRFLARRGYAAVGFDFSTTALAEARALAKTDNVTAEFVERDLFTLGLDYGHAFDGIWEYTCFCAIEPRRRAEYVRTMSAILKPGGWLLACFFPMRRRAAGPPFPVSEREVRRLFAPGFRIERAYAPRSVRPRQGQEWMVLLRKVC
jgi:SAM-dependent methyltransferase